MHESSMISNDFADAINGVHVSSTFIFEPKFAFWDTKTVVLLFLRYRPKRTRIDLFRMHFPSISSICIDFRKCYKNQWILNDFAPADRPDRSRRPFFAKSKIALPLRKYPHFRSSTGDFHHDLGCPLRGGHPGRRLRIGIPNRPRIGPI